MLSCSLGASLAVSSQPLELVLRSWRLCCSWCVDYAKAILQQFLDVDLFRFTPYGQLEGAGASLLTPLSRRAEIGRASCRERV